MGMNKQKEFEFVKFETVYLIVCCMNYELENIRAFTTKEAAEAWINAQSNSKWLYIEDISLYD